MRNPAAESFLQGPQELSSSTGGVISIVFISTYETQHLHQTSPPALKLLSTRKANYYSNLQQVKFVLNNPITFNTLQVPTKLICFREEFVH